eukprot:COSAG02_NODE_737_length_17855_cov_18.729049_11_plen_76_part_00
MATGFEILFVLGGLFRAAGGRSQALRPRWGAGWEGARPLIWLFNLERTVTELIIETGICLFSPISSANLFVLTGK